MFYMWILIITAKVLPQIWAGEGREKQRMIQQAKLQNQAKDQQIQGIEQLKTSVPHGTSRPKKLQIQCLNL